MNDHLCFVEGIRTERKIIFKKAVILRVDLSGIDQTLLENKSESVKFSISQT